MYCIYSWFISDELRTSWMRPEEVLGLVLSKYAVSHFLRPKIVGYATSHFLKSLEC